MQPIAFSYRDSALVDADEIASFARELTTYAEELLRVSKDPNYGTPESSINVPADPAIASAVREIAKKLRTDALKHVIVVGIGGSSLGTKAIWEALAPARESGTGAKIVVADTVAASVVAPVIECIERASSKEEIVLNVVSASGTTTETVANFEAIYAAFAKKFGDVEDRIVVTTVKNSDMWLVAEGTKMHRLEIAAGIGGRYSVLSAVGQLPLALAGVDVEKLSEGGRYTLKRCTSPDVNVNISMLSAIVAFAHLRRGLSISNLFVFEPAFAGLGAWWRQLVGESLSKSEDALGSTITAGLTPTVAIGSTDLHSMLQRYLAGPRDTFTTFMRIERYQENIAIPKELKLGRIIDGVAEHTLDGIMDAIYRAITKTYAEHELPFAEISFMQLSAHALGQFLEFKMIETMFLSKLMGVNAFDQPAVESYKRLTKEILDPGRGPFGM